MNIDKLIKDLGQDTIEELDHMSDDELQKTVVQAEIAIKESKEELDANDAYIQAKLDVKLLSSGYSEVKKRQNGKIRYSLHRLEELGKMDSTAKDEFESNRAKRAAKKDA